MIKTGDYVRWKWSAPDLVNGLSFEIEQVEDAASTKPVGFTSGEPIPSGMPINLINLVNFQN